jgi:hypothetical protein
MKWVANDVYNEKEEMLSSSLQKAFYNKKL